MNSAHNGYGKQSRSHCKHILTCSHSPQRKRCERLVRPRAIKKVGMVRSTIPTFFIARGLTSLLQCFKQAALAKLKCFTVRSLSLIHTPATNVATEGR